jgi:hypothetical protein
VAPAPAQTTSKTLIERALAGEFGDFNRNLALAQQQRGADTKDTTIAVDNGTARDDEAKIRKDLAEKYQRAPLDLTYLNEAESFARDSLRAEEGGANANFDRLRRQQEGEQKQETGELSTGLARAGGYLGFTGSGEAVMLSLTKSHRAELQDLESRRTQALSEARQAYNDQMYDVAREKQDIANEYEQQQYAEKQKYFDEVNKKLNSFLLYNHCCFTTHFLISKMERAIENNEQEKLYEENTDFLPNYEPDKADVPNYINWSKYSAVSAFYAKKYQEAVQILNGLVNDISFKNFPHSEIEIKLLLALNYSMINKYDPATSLLRSVTRKIREINDEMGYENALVFYKILSLQMSSSARQVDQKIGQLFAKFELLNQKSNRMLEYIKIDEGFIIALSQVV